MTRRWPRRLMTWPSRVMTRLSVDPELLPRLRLGRAGRRGSRRSAARPPPWPRAPGPPAASRSSSEWTTTAGCGHAEAAQPQSFRRDRPLPAVLRRVHIVQREDRGSAHASAGPPPAAGCRRGAGSSRPPSTARARRRHRARRRAARRRSDQGAPRSPMSLSTTSSSGRRGRFGREDGAVATQAAALATDVQEAHAQRCVMPCVPPSSRSERRHGGAAGPCAGWGRASAAPAPTRER